MYCNTKYSWQQKLPITLTLNLVAIPRSYFNYYKFDDNQYPLVAKITYFCNQGDDGSESINILQPNDILVTIPPI